MTRNQVQIFSVMKCIEASEVTICTYHPHPFIKASDGQVGGGVDAPLQLALEKTNMFHNVFKVWINCGNTVEKLWKSSSTILSIFHDMELKLNVE